MSQRKNQKTKKNLETNKNGNITHKNLYNAAKSLLRELCGINTYSKKQEKSN